MAEIPGLTLDQKKVAQRINLKADFDFDVASRPDSELILQQIGQDMIDLIVDRTEANKDVDGNRFDKYSKAYIDSDSFAAYGKSASDVNLTQSGGMLADIDITQAKGNVLEIGHVDSTETEKAYNHNTGDTVTPRPYFGVPKKDLQKIIEKYKKQEESEEITKEQGQILDLLKQTSPEGQKSRELQFNEIFATVFGGDFFGQG